MLVAKIVSKIANVVVCKSASQEGTANYLKGFMLVLCYCIVGASFFVHVDPPIHHVHTLEVSNPLLAN